MFSKLIAEIYKRRIGRNLIVYLGSAWILIEVFSYFTKRFDWPKSVEDVVFVILVFGIPASIIYAWFHGEEGTQKVTRKEIGLYGFNLAIASFFIFQALTHYEHVSSSINNNIVSADIEKSIAVKPFDNESSDEENLYFVNGMMEDIRNNLAKISELRVISKTSSEKYRNSALTSQEIGKELSINYLLEGTVQKIDNQIKIHAQLISTTNDDHIWQNTYLRDITDIKEVFKVQSEIAQVISAQLNIIISPAEKKRLETFQTNNLEAYNLYLTGRHFFHKRTRGNEELKKSIEYFEKSLAIDSLYALAHAGLADASLLVIWRESRHDFNRRSDIFTGVKTHLQKALEIDPNLAEAHAVLGLMTCFFDWQWEEGGKFLEKAIEINPNYSTAHQYYSQYLNAILQPDDARVEINKALELNPLSSQQYIVSSSLYFNQGKLDESLADVLRAKELDDNRPGVYWKMFHIYKEQGKEEKAMRQLKHLWSMDSSLVENIKFLDDIYTKNGMNGVIKWWMGFEENKNPNKPHYIAMNYASIGENSLALKWLEKAFDLGGPDLPSMINNRMFENIRSDPRFVAMLKKMGLVSEKK